MNNYNILHHPQPPPPHHPTMPTHHPTMPTHHPTMPTHQSTLPSHHPTLCTTPIHHPAVSPFHPTMPHHPTTPTHHPTHHPTIPTLSTTPTHHHTLSDELFFPPTPTAGFPSLDDMLCPANDFYPSPITFPDLNAQPGSVLHLPSVRDPLIPDSLHVGVSMVTDSLHACSPTCDLMSQEILTPESDNFTAQAISRDMVNNHGNTHCNHGNSLAYVTQPTDVGARLTFTPPNKLPDTALHNSGTPNMQAYFQPSFSECNVAPPDPVWTPSYDNTESLKTPTPPTLTALTEMSSNTPPPAVASPETLTNHSAVYRARDQSSRVTYSVPLVEHFLPSTTTIPTNQEVVPNDALVQSAFDSTLEELFKNDSFKELMSSPAEASPVNANVLQNIYDDVVGEHNDFSYQGDSIAGSCVDLSALSFMEFPYQAFPKNSNPELNQINPFNQSSDFDWSKYLPKKKGPVSSPNPEYRPIDFMNIAPSIPSLPPTLVQKVSKHIDQDETSKYKKAYFSKRKHQPPASSSSCIDMLDENTPPFTPDQTTCCNHGNTDQTTCCNHGNTSDQFSEQTRKALSAHQHNTHTCNHGNQPNTHYNHGNTHTCALAQCRQQPAPRTTCDIDDDGAISKLQPQINRSLYNEIKCNNRGNKASCYSGIVIPKKSDHPFGNMTTCFNFKSTGNRFIENVAPNLYHAARSPSSNTPCQGESGGNEVRVISDRTEKAHIRKLLTDCGDEVFIVRPKPEFRHTPVIDNRKPASRDRLSANHSTGYRSRDRLSCQLKKEKTCYMCNKRFRNSKQFVTHYLKFHSRIR